MNKSIIIGGNHHNTLSVIRALGRKGLKSDVLIVGGGRHPFVGRSRYIANLFVFDSYSEIIPFLLSHYDSEDEKPLITCCCDHSSSLVDINHNELSLKFIIPGCEVAGRITYYMDKCRMLEAAEKCGLTVIPGKTIAEGMDINPDELSFPCIVKPLASINGGKSYIRVFHSVEDVSAFQQSGGHPAFQLQKFIDKEFEYQLIGCSVNGGEEIIIPGRTLIIHQPRETNTGYLHYECLDGTEPVEECKSYIRKIGYSGLFSIEFLRGLDGKNYFMEMNFRNDGNAISVTDAGVNLPYIWYLAGTGRPYSDEKKCIKPLFVIPEFCMLGLWYNGELSWSDLKSAFCQAGSYMDYAEDDPAPSFGKFGVLIDLFCKSIKKPIKKLLRDVEGKILSNNS